MKTKLNFLMVITLLVGLVLSIPAQTVMAASEANFTFTSTLSPSNYMQSVTFTLSATGTDPNYQPFGYVYFYDNGTQICVTQYLNMDSGGVLKPGTPAACTISNLAPGSHVITAFFDSLAVHIYADATLTLEGGQTVNDPPPATIIPDTLLDVVYGTYTTQRLTATWGGAFRPEYIGWRVIEGSLPAGITLENLYSGGEYFGELYGAPGSAGAFSFTVEAYDNYWRPLGTKTYNWNILKATPSVTFGEIQKYYSGTSYISLHVQHPNPYWDNQPAGPVTVFVDGNPLADCTAIGPIFLGFYQCATTALGELAPGDHTIQADFTPDANHAPNYESASGTMPYEVLPRVEGVLFNDLDRDGVRDEGEELAANADVQLDQGCDGSYVSKYAYGGQFSIVTSPGSEYCLTVSASGNWRPTTDLPIRFTVEGYQNQYFEIGLYETIISFSPDPLPNGSVGEYYEQAINIDGGKPPYEITGLEENLPGGMIFNQSTLILSGTPSAVGNGLIYLAVKDSEGMAASRYLTFTIQTDGVFTLVSDPNPSTPGQEVTFTFTGSGDIVIPDYGTIPPFGIVAFYDGDDLITGCEEVYLNYDWDYGPSDRPAICQTSTLTEGSHSIWADFTPDPYFPLYRDATRTLTQIVQASIVSADLSLSKTDKTDPVKPGAKLDYTLVVSNAGPNPAQNLSLVDRLDVNTTFVSVSAPKGWTCAHSKGTVTCASASLTSGSSATIKITVTVSKTAKVGKELVNNALVSSTTYDPDLLNNNVVQKTLVAK
jgi:uncharacterized repeat protein (TIGR01451 family)